MHLRDDVSSIIVVIGLENEYHSMKRERSSTNQELENVTTVKSMLQEKVMQLQAENER